MIQISQSMCFASLKVLHLKVLVKKILYSKKNSKEILLCSGKFSDVPVLVDEMNQVQCGGHKEPFKI